MFMKRAKPINIYVLLIVFLAHFFHLDPTVRAPLLMVLRVIGSIVDEILRLD